MDARMSWSCGKARFKAQGAGPAIPRGASNEASHAERTAGREQQARTACASPSVKSPAE